MCFYAVDICVLQFIFYWIFGWYRSMLDQVKQVQTIAWRRKISYCFNIDYLPWLLIVKGKPSFNVLPAVKWNIMDVEGKCDCNFKGQESVELMMVPDILTENSDTFNVNLRNFGYFIYLFGLEIVYLILDISQNKNFVFDWICTWKLCSFFNLLSECLFVADFCFNFLFARLFKFISWL